MLASFRLVSFSESLVKIEDQEQKHHLEKAGIVSQIDSFEAVVQQQKLDIIAREKNLSVQQKATNEYVSKIRAYESEKKLKNEQLKFQQDKDTRLSEELERDMAQLSQVLSSIKRLTEEKASDDETLETLKEQLTDLRENVNELRSKESSSKGELSELANINTRLQNQLYKAGKDIDILQIQQQSLEQESERNTEDASTKQAELFQFNDVVEQLEHRVEVAEDELQTIVDFEANLQEQIVSTEGELNEVQEIVVRESRKLDAKQNEYNLTKSLVDNLEGFPDSIRFLKKNNIWAENTYLLGDILFCKEEFRVAVESFLEPLLNHYIVDSYDEAITAINLLSYAAQGRAKFFILNNFDDDEYLQPQSHIESEILKRAGAILALKVVEVESRYQKLCNYLLSNVYLVDDEDDEDINNFELPKGAVVIGKSGKFNKSKFRMAGGSVGVFEGKRIGRTKNLDNLSQEIKELEENVNNLKSRVEELQGNLSDLKSSGRELQIKIKQKEINQLNTELITVKTRQEQYQNFMNSSINRKDDIARKIIAIKGEIQNLLPQLEELKTQKQIQSDLLADKQENFNELNEYVTVESNKFNQENIRFHQQQNKVSGLAKDLDYLETQQENLDSRIVKNTTELEQVKTAIRDFLMLADTSDDDLQEMYNQKDELERATQLAEQEYYDWRGKITTTENEITALRRKKDNAEIIENELKDQRNNLKLELNALKERLSVEFGVDINELPETETTGDENEQDVREKTEKLKRQLDDFGPINPMAVEAYNEMNERHNFILVQKKDLSDAKESLLATIQEIDDTAREKFMSSFVLVRENFIKVFRSLFNEEDSCDLILTDPQHPLESDIEILAKPKGKRPLSINQLSGGEKTLTATAILFSLYLLKPAPFCIFDEVDAPLDDTNIDKFNNIIREFSKESQFIIISHNKRTIAATDIVYGVTMVEQGISKVVPVDLRELVD
jgi:chromosome segregation protein